MPSPLLISYLSFKIWFGWHFILNSLPKALDSIRFLPLGSFNTVFNYIFSLFALTLHCTRLSAHLSSSLNFKQLGATDRDAVSASLMFNE